MSLLPSCSGLKTVHAGMTKQEVSSQLGAPTRVDRKPDGKETWYYTGVRKSRSTSWSNNYNRPGESVYERDLRIDLEDGVTAGMEISDVETYEEQALHFDSDGRLLNTPAYSFPSSE